MNAMIFAAGLGTRLKPFTDTAPKALAPVDGKPILQHNIEYLQRYGIFNVIVNVHHFANQIVEVLERNRGWGSNITISDESDEVLETGGGLKKAASFLSETQSCVVMNADVLTNMPLDEMIRHHEHNKPLATLATTKRQTSRYLLFNDMDRLCGWRNEATGCQKIPVTLTDSSNLFKRAFSGIHIIDRELFRHLKREGKFSMIDVYLDLCPYHTILSYDHSGSWLIDIGTPEKLASAEKHFRQQMVL
jgi:N-acetyl-alpha-D-muramate 1-phosphate uridylyltransferase